MATVRFKHKHIFMLNGSKVITILTIRKLTTIMPRDSGCGLEKIDLTQLSMV